MIYLPRLHVIGGAAILLAYDSRAITRDVDALFAPDGPILDAAREVANQMGWPRSWLNNQASSYMSRTPGEGAVVFDHPYLLVVAMPADHLLAMKVLAARPVRDREDIELLPDRLRIEAATVGRNTHTTADRRSAQIGCFDPCRISLADSHC